ncbi:MAG TPA: hypothetical protein VFR78_12660 [Pyrinomonadaceae bacterium]|nr:hypothetical protein [Pyrinomonadaceae bacterium]
MKEEILTDAMLREFLLGKLDDERRERIESLFLTDSQAREKILAVEEDLIEDYLEDSLTAADKELFLLRYRQTPVQQRQLEIDKSIKKWALRESAVAKTSLWASLRSRLALKPAFVIPIAVMAVVAIAVTVVWLRGSLEQRNRRLAIEQELARLNTPAAFGESPPNMTRLELTHGTVRSGEQETEWKKTAGSQLVELRLPWTQRERYSKYRVEVSRVGDVESYTIPDLQAENAPGHQLRIRLPANFLHRGHYVIRVTGIPPDGSSGATDEYTFAVSE